MPNVPRAPGVPSLASFAADAIVLLTSDLISALAGLFGPPQWGVFLDAEQAIDYRSVVNFEYKKDSPLSDYPVQDGGFQSYDKVQLPFDVRLTLVSGPSLADRQSFIESLEAAAASLDLYDVVTPEKTYVDCNIGHTDFRRSATNGVGIVSASVWFEEIRQTSTATFTSTKDASSQGQTALGNQQPQAPSDATEQSFDSGNWQVQ